MTSHDGTIQKSAAVTFVLAPFSGGQRKSGVAQGPSALVSDPILQVSLENAKLIYSLAGDSDDQLQALEAAHPRATVGKVRNFDLVSAFNQQLSQRVRDASKKGMVVTFGGDHSIAIGSVSGILAEYPRLKVVSVDAHTDINTLSSTVSGNLHGCPVSFLMGIADSVMSWLPSQLPPSALVYVGLRDVEPQEMLILEQYGIKAFFMEDIARLGFDEVIAEVMNFVEDAPVHISLDVDGLDPSIAGATGVPVTGGLTFDQVKKLFQNLREENVVSMDVVEVNPEVGSAEDQEKTVFYANRLVEVVLGIDT